MSKIFAHIFLSVLLLLSTTGIAVSKHFCNELLVSTSIYAEAESCCDSDSCCNTVTSIYNLDEEFTAPVFYKLPASVEFDLLFLTPSTKVLIHLLNENQRVLPKIESPPPPSIQKRLSLGQVYLL